MRSAHHQSKPLRGLGVAALVTLMLGGCYEEIDAPRYEAGVYKGSDDPLTAKIESGELQQQLAERFELAAQDR